MNCNEGETISIKKFHEAYPEYAVELISCDIDMKCKWVLKI